MRSTPFLGLGLALLAVSALTACSSGGPGHQSVAPSTTQLDSAAAGLSDASGQAGAAGTAAAQTASPSAESTDVAAPTAANPDTATSPPPASVAPAATKSTTKATGTQATTPASPSPTQPTAPAAQGEDCGRITPAGWPSTTAPNPDVGACLQRNFTAGTPAVVTEVSYSGTNGAGPEFRHVITYAVIARQLMEKTTDWSGATAGPVGTVTVEHCTGLTGSYVFTVSGCSPA